ncbi:hypothetical protein CANMA_002773 [Candida margitis]|uniref:uncharacterized protein n=1 Tax=Candida margitis TaxID=1775924 RepID=UPI002226C0CC|nr:uncharacterized protein CANMA_002773 [Candida margitis]KAI5968005.1 hypothetical protein CANMA_002773 [Candida margitis]
MSSSSSSDFENRLIHSSRFKHIESPHYYLDENLHENKIDEQATNASEINVTSPQSSKLIKPIKSIWSKNGRRYLIAVSVVLALFVIALVFVITSTKLLNDPVKEGAKVEKLTNIKYQQLKAIRTNLIDHDTSRDEYSKSHNWQLVFSDEFNKENRTFGEHEDQFFTAVDLHYRATQDLEYYLPHMATTKNGSLVITFDKFNHSNLQYVSAMLQSWNKLCFNKQARIEVRAKLPPDVQYGLWPAVWSLGNLARPGYLATTDGLWPYTYNDCDLGITRNQSTLNENMSYLPGQRLSVCTCFGEDHPNTGVGRGAPEIDIIEGLFEHGRVVGVQTVQVAPFDEWWRPDYDYVDINNKNVTYIREDVGTIYQESISLATILKSDGFVEFAMEYRSLPSGHGYVKFEMNGVSMFTINETALRANGLIGSRQITKEPMSIIFNMGLSKIWNPKLQIDKLQFPAKFYIDYIRVYQPLDAMDLTCDPEGFPTSSYIESHLNAYLDWELDTWSDAGYQFPQNSLESKCRSPSVFGSG